MNDALMALAGVSSVVAAAMLGRLLHRPVDAAQCALLACAAGVVLTVTLLPQGEIRAAVLCVLMMGVGYSLGSSVLKK